MFDSQILKDTFQFFYSSPPTPNKTGWWFQIFFIFTPIWGRFPIWTNIFQGGWNHQLEKHTNSLFVNVFHHFFRTKNGPPGWLKPASSLATWVRENIGSSPRHQRKAGGFGWLTTSGTFEGTPRLMIEYGSLGGSKVCGGIVCWLIGIKSIHSDGQILRTCFWKNSQMFYFWGLHT